LSSRDEGEITMKRYPVSWDEVPIIVDLPYVARLLEVTPETVRKWCIKKIFPGIKFGEKEWRVDKDDLRAYMRQNKAMDVAGLENVENVLPIEKLRAKG